MALTGQLSDMSLAELIEFFCNQRKTGRLKVDYHRGHGVFFIKDGELVDAKVGALSGADAVYFALTLPNAAFDFSTDFEPPRRTIRESWTQVVLEGLRRLDEGVSPGESDAFGADWKPSEADMLMFMDQVERLGEKVSAGTAAREAAAAAAKEADASNAAGAAPPMSMMVESASAEGAGKRRMVMVGAAVCVVLACAVAAIPLSRRFSASKDSSAVSAPVAEQSASPANTTGEGDAGNASSIEADASTEAAPSEEGQATASAAEVASDPQAAAREAQRLREARERAARERERKLEEARKNESAQKPAEASSVAPAPAAAAGPKSVRVSVAYDESGRVTQASVAGTSPGAEAYGATAVRIARGRRFPAGKAGGTVITIPIN